MKQTKYLKPKDPCPFCGGQGWLDGSTPERHYKRLPAVDDCPECEGRGDCAAYFEHERCPHGHPDDALRLQVEVGNGIDVSGVVCMLCLEEEDLLREERTIGL